LIQACLDGLGCRIGSFKRENYGNLGYGTTKIPKIISIKVFICLGAMICYRK